MSNLINRSSSNRSTPVEPTPHETTPIQRDHIQPTPRSFTAPPAIKPGDPTVLVNGKPVDPAQEGGKNPASGATKEAAAAKVAEQKLSGQAQEAKVRSLWADTQKDLDVKVIEEPAHSKDDQQNDCDGQNNIKEKK